MKSIALISFLFISAGLLAQSVSPQVIATAGNYSEAGGISLSWTLGEPVIETAVSTDVTLTQGFQQPDYTLVVIEHTPAASLDVNVFPNPTTGNLNIQWTGDAQTQALVYLYDMNGKQLVSQKVATGNQTGILNLSEYANAQYILKIVASDIAFSKEYRIVKE